MAGASLSARFAALPETTFVLTALYGQADLHSNLAAFQSAPPGLNVIAQRTSEHDNRYDIELSAQTAMPDTRLATIFGLRLELDNASFKGTQASMIGGVTSVSPIDFLISQKLATARAGIAYSIPLNEAGNLTLFGNFMLLGGILSSSGAGNAPLQGA